MALSDVLANIAYRAGKKPSAKALRNGVPRSNEFKRIERLPRRQWEDDPQLDELNRLLQVTYGREESTMPLWRTQVAALRDLVEQGGLLAPIPVGGGKAFVSILAPVVYGARGPVRRPVLFVPPKLRRQTNEEVIPLLTKHWHLHDDFLVLGSNYLSLAQNADMLWVRRPSMIIIDEGHEWKNLQAARVRRLKRYLKAYPHTVVVILSGTIARKSIRDYAHLSEWALHEGSPVPRNESEIETWSRCLDPGIDEYDRLDGGALLRFCEEGENAREGFRRRLVETPGVVAGPERALDVSLFLDERKVEVPDAIIEALQRIEDTWETPGGEQIAEAAGLWRAARQLACGFYYKWDPLPPRPWLEARREWKQFVRHTLRYNRRGLDSELQVWNDCKRMKVQPSPWLIWKQIKDTFDPNSVAVWVDDFLVDDAGQWLVEHPTGIVWTEHVAFGERFENYHGGGTELIGVTGPIVASVRAHGEGKNLQDRWDSNLVVSCPSAAKTVQQLLGRTHREGQLSDVVSADFYFHTQVLRDSWNTAVEQAVYLEQTTGNRQKILYADKGFKWRN